MEYIIIAGQWRKLSGVWTGKTKSVLTEIDCFLKMFSDENMTVQSQ